MFHDVSLHLWQNYFKRSYCEKHFKMCIVSKNDLIWSYFGYNSLGDIFSEGKFIFWNQHRSCDRFCLTWGPKRVLIIETLGLFRHLNSTFFWSAIAVCFIVTIRDALCTFCTPSTTGSWGKNRLQKVLPKEATPGRMRRMDQKPCHPTLLFMFGNILWWRPLNIYGIYDRLLFFEPAVQEIPTCCSYNSTTVGKVYCTVQLSKYVTVLRRPVCLPIPGPLACRAHKNQ